MDHDEIYLQPVCCVNEDIGRLWCEDADPEDCEDGKHWTRYVRADIHESAIAEIEQLRQERDGLRETNHALVERLDELCRVRNERDGLRADAVRYRWLRDVAWDDGSLIFFDQRYDNREWDEKIDERIETDKAMAKEQSNES